MYKTFYFYIYNFSHFFFLEAEASSQAGIKSILVHREGNAPLFIEDKERFITIESFNELF